MGQTPAKKQIIVYNTRTQKEYPIHPAMAQDPAWMAARGLIIQEQVKSFEVTNLPEPPASPAQPAKTKATR